MFIVKGVSGEPVRVGDEVTNAVLAYAALPLTENTDFQAGYDEAEKNMNEYLTRLGTYLVPSTLEYEGIEIMWRSELEAVIK